MKKLKSFTLIMLLFIAALSSACTETCETCNLKPGTVVRYVDADSVAYDYTAGADGCIRFEAEDCSKFMAVDRQDPAPMINNN